MHTKTTQQVPNSQTRPMVGSATAHAARPSRGYSWWEILVVLLVVALLLILLIPAINNSREGARRVTCEERLRGLAGNVLKFETLHAHYPAGTLVPEGPSNSTPSELANHPSWLGQILPHFAPAELADAFNAQQDLTTESNTAVRRQRLSELLCPSDFGPPTATAEPPANPWPYSNYAGNHHPVEAPLAADNQGMLFVNSHVTRADVTDGIEYTLLLSEKIGEVHDFGWLSGSRATLRNTGHAINAAHPKNATLAENTAQPAAAVSGSAEPATAAPAEVVGGFLSFHPGGVNAAFAGGEIRFIQEDIDRQVWQAFGHRSDQAASGPPTSPGTP